MGDCTPPRNPNGPASVLNTESTLLEIKLKIKSTPDIGGSVLGIIKPVWQKTMESEQRISWLKEMLERDLVLRDIMKFSQIVQEKLRTESSKQGELGRQVLVEIMRVKHIDEKRYYRECKRIRESLRDFLRMRFGRKRYNKIIESLKEHLEAKRGEL